MSNSTFKSFGAFILQAAKLNLDRAVAVAVYVKTRDDVVYEVRHRIEKDCDNGVITTDRRDVLLGITDQCHELYRRIGRIVDARDSRDWRDLGNNARMRIVHKNSDTL